jgi:hypothetical protein
MMFYDNLLELEDLFPVHLLKLMALITMHLQVLRSILRQ